MGRQCYVHTAGRVCQVLSHTSLVCSYPGNSHPARAPPPFPPQVLTIGATNLAQDLDQALLRPGRFEAVFEIPSPGWRCLVISKCTSASIIVLHLRRSPSEPWRVPARPIARRTCGVILVHVTLPPLNHFECCCTQAPLLAWRSCGTTAATSRWRARHCFQA